MYSEDLINEDAGLRPKGRVTIELYDPDTNRVIERREYRNIVTNSASIVIANVLADPNGFTTIDTEEVLDTDNVADATGYYPLQLKYHRSERQTQEVTGTGAEVIGLGLTRRMTKLYRVSVNGIEMQVGKDVWIASEDAGSIRFASAPPVGAQIVVEYAIETNPRVYFKPGSETVTVGVETYRRSTTTDAKGRLIPTTGTYVIDEETGRLWFSAPLQGVRVAYSYGARKGLAYMGISDRPDNHPAGRPIVYTEAHKGRTTMDKEYVGARQPLIFPATVTTGSSYTEVIIGNGYDTVFTLSQRDLLEILEAYNVSKAQFLEVGTDIVIHNAETGQIRFATPPEQTDVIRIQYTWNSGSTVSFVADFPRGVPGPQVVTATYTNTTEDHNGDGAVDTQYILPDEPTQILNATLDGVALTQGVDFIVNGRNFILTSTPAAGRQLVVEYQYGKTTVDIYSVALFDALEGGNMFAMSGIGPIGKDQSVGMRVTWSITF